MVLRTSPASAVCLCSCAQRLSCEQLCFKVVLLIVGSGMALYAAPSESGPLLNGQRGPSSDGEEEKDSCWKRFEARIEAKPKPSASKAGNDTTSTASNSTTAESARAKYLAMTTDQLRCQCDDARLSAAGSKEELVARLVDSANADSSKP